MMIVQAIVLSFIPWEKIDNESSEAIVVRLLIKLELVTLPSKLLHSLKPQMHALIFNEHHLLVNKFVLYILRYEA